MSEFEHGDAADEYLKAQKSKTPVGDAAEKWLQQQAGVAHEAIQLERPLTSEEVTNYSYTLIQQLRATLLNLEAYRHAWDQLPADPRDQPFATFVIGNTLYSVYDSREDHEGQDQDVIIKWMAADDSQALTEEQIRDFDQNKQKQSEVLFQYRPQPNEVSTEEISIISYRSPTEYRQIVDENGVIHKGDITNDMLVVEKAQQLIAQFGQNSQGSGTN